LRVAVPRAAALLDEGLGADLKPENRLRRALVESLADCGLAEICWSPEWKPEMPRWPRVSGGTLGGFDLALRAEGEAPYSAVCELKWSNWGDREALDEVPWDAFKLAHAVATLPEVSLGFLIYAARASAWSRPARFVEWFEGAEISSRDFFEGHPTVWRWLLEGSSKARPIALPEVVRTEPLVASGFQWDGEAREICVASVEVPGEEWFDLEGGWPRRL
jgi:hypothetical protein